MKELLTYTALATLSLSTLAYGATCPDPSYLEISDNGTVSFSEEYQDADYWNIQQSTMPSDVYGFRFTLGMWKNYYAVNNVSCSYNNENGLNNALVYIVGVKNVGEPMTPNWTINSENGDYIERVCIMGNVKECPFFYGDIR